MTARLFFKVSFAADNAAFHDAGTEIARILRNLAERVEIGARQGTIWDVNGNLIGDFHLGDFT